MQIVKTFTSITQHGDRKTAIVYYHADWQEFFVRFFINGKHMRKMFYPADNRQDAIAKAEHFIFRD